MFLINLLIFLFIILLSYQLFLNFSQNKEGLENMASPTPLPAPTPNPYNVGDSNNALALSQQNAADIAVLKSQVNELDVNKNKIVVIQQQISSMQTQIDGLVQQQADYANELAGSNPPTITGTEPESAP